MPLNKWPGLQTTVEFTAAHVLPQTLGASRGYGDIM